MALREIVFDTETTGLNANGGDRVVEIGCVEMVNHVPTGRTFHRYINPQRDMPQEAFAVHGLSTEFLADKPLFAEIAEEFVGFIEGARLVAHNAAFDVAFLDAELRRLGHGPIPAAMVVDTLQLARRKFPFGALSLDALCQRFGIDNSRRTKHGALLDAEILAEVYIELLGGRQADLGLVDAKASAAVIRTGAGRAASARPAPLPQRLTTIEIEAHRAFVATLGSAPVWQDYVQSPEEVAS